MIRVQPGAHYRIESFVQTTPLPNARAVMSGYFTDVDGHELGLGRAVRALFRTHGRAGMEAPLHRAYRQRSQGRVSWSSNWPCFSRRAWRRTALGNRALYTQDIHGSAWFDDVAVSQVPKVTMTSERPGNIFHRSDPLRLQVSSTIASPTISQAQIVIRDADGQNGLPAQRRGGCDGAAQKWSRRASSG